jgi:bacterioferritin-associated ferredoxin
MYVCMCNGYRCSDLKAAAQKGEKCARRAYFSLGGGPRCGRCLDLAQTLMDEAAAVMPKTAQPA